MKSEGWIGRFGLSHLCIEVLAFGGSAAVELFASTRFESRRMDMVVALC